MEGALNVHRLHFAFTVTFHYIFPQLTMGLALLIVYLKTKFLRTNDERYNTSAKFWARIFGINFAVGVVTGIPMEFQFGTNWAEFSKSAGGVIGQTLAMEGVFSFFLESSFLGLFLFGEKKLGRIGHWWAAFLVWLGSWLSGYLIVATDTWMQHPPRYTLGPHGEIQLSSFWQLLVNSWSVWQYAHTMLGAGQTGCFVMAAIGAFYLLTNRHEVYGRIFVKGGVLVGMVAALLQLFPTGDTQGKLISQHQPITLAAMEGVFHTQTGAPLAILGQPDVQKRKLDNPAEFPKMLSFLTYRNWSADIRGLDAFPEEDWPDMIPLLYYCYHVMVGLGTIFIAVMVLSALLCSALLCSALARQAVCLPPDALASHALRSASLHRQHRRLDDRRAWPATVADLRPDAHRHGISPRVAAGNAWFTLIGFMGLYMVLGILWLFLIYREIELGPDPDKGSSRREDAVAIAAD